MTGSASRNCTARLSYCCNNCSHFRRT